VQYTYKIENKKMGSKDRWANEKRKNKKLAVRKARVSVG